MSNIISHRNNGNRRVYTNNRSIETFKQKKYSDKENILKITIQWLTISQKHIVYFSISFYNTNQNPITIEMIPIMKIDGLHIQLVSNLTFYVYIM